MLTNEPKIGHVQIWSNYFKLAMLLESNDHAGIGDFMSSTVVGSDYVQRMVRYFMTGDIKFSPIVYKAKDSYVGYVNTPVSSFDDSNVQRKKVTINATLADNVITAYRQLVARTRLDSSDDMTFLAFCSALLVRSGTFTWSDIEKETTQETPHVVEIDGNETTAYVKSQILDRESDNGESWFSIAKSLNVTSSQLA